MNSKDLRNISEAYQNIQEQGRPARRRRPSKSVEQIKAEIDAKNPTKTGPVTGQKVPGVQQSRPATRIPGATGEKPTGSLRSGNLVFPGDTSGAYDAAKQKLSTPKVEVPKIETPPQTQGLLGTRNVPSTQELIQQRGGAPKPQFPGSANTGQSFPKPPTVTRDAGAFARQRLNLRASQVNQVAGQVSRGRQLVKNLRNLTLGGLATYGIAKGLEALDQGETKPTSGLTPEQQKSRTDAANQARRSGKSANIPPGEGMVNNPDYMKKPVQRPAKELSAAAKDFDKTFAAAREKGLKTFPWRGKTYNTKLKGE